MIFGKFNVAGEDLNTSMTAKDSAVKFSIGLEVLWERE